MGAKNVLIDQAVKHVKLRQGVLGIKVKIMLPHSLDGKMVVMPDKVTIHEKVKSAWELDPADLQKGYAEQAQVDEFVQGDQEIPQEEYGAPEEQGFGQPEEQQGGFGAPMEQQAPPVPD